MTAATPTETDNAQELSRLLLAIATSAQPHVGLTALIMATSVGARALNIPLENIVALFDKTTAEVYTVAEETGFGNTVN